MVGVSANLPDLTAYGAVLFDLDGVITPTADVHRRSWLAVFDELFSQRGIVPPYSEDDYFEHLDGKKRYDGVASLLASRGVELPWGDPSDGPEAGTICGIGNRKNVVFSRVLADEGIAPYPGTIALLDALGPLPAAIVSSSKNAEAVLMAAGVRDRFPVVVDGVIAEREHLPSKPAPDVFLAGARMLGVDPATSVAIEDAISGVESAAAGGFGLVVGVDRGAGHDALAAAGAHIVVDDLSRLVPSVSSGRIASSRG